MYTYVHIYTYNNIQSTHSCRHFGKKVAIAFEAYVSCVSCWRREVNKTMCILAQCAVVAVEKGGKGRRRRELQQC